MEVAHENPFEQAAIDPALLAAIQKQGYCFLVSELEDAETILSHNFPALGVPEAELLTQETIGPLTAAYILPRPGLSGERFGQAVGQRLKEIRWRGTAKLLTLPLDCPSLMALADRYRAEPVTFGVALAEMVARQDVPTATFAPKAEDEWPDPVPFNAPTILPPFPLEALPPALARYAAEVAATRQVPADLPAMLQLGVVSAAGARRVRVHIGETHQEPINLYVAVGMASGERKSPTFLDMTAPLEAYEQARHTQAAADIIEATERRTMEEATLRSLREKAVKTEDATEREALIAEASALAQALTEVPLEPRLIAGDVTPEKLASLLAEHGGRFAVMDAEAGGIFAIMAGRYTRDGGLNLDVYLRGHSGDALRVDRVGRPSVHVRSPALTMVLTPQPDVIRSLADKPGFRGRGLLARFLYALPASLVGTRKYKNRATDLEARRTYEAVIRAILELPPAQEIEGITAYDPLSIAGEALSLWAEFADTVESDQAEEGPLAGIRDWASKLSGAVARIAGCLHLVEHAQGTRKPWEVPIAAKTILAAWAIGEYLQAHALAAFAMMGADPHVSLAQRLLKWIERHAGKPFTLRDCHQAHRSLSVITKPDDLLPALEVLEGRGFIRRVESTKAKGPGRPQSLTFEVNPKVLLPPQNTQNTQN